MLLQSQDLKVPNHERENNVNNREVPSEGRVMPQLVCGFIKRGVG
jgi:hypothetical protein